MRIAAAFAGKVLQIGAQMAYATWEPRPLDTANPPSISHTTKGIVEKTLESCLVTSTRGVKLIEHLWTSNRKSCQAPLPSVIQAEQSHSLCFLRSRPKTDNEGVGDTQYSRLLFRIRISDRHATSDDVGEGAAVAGLDCIIPCHVKHFQWTALIQPFRAAKCAKTIVRS